MKKNTRRQRVKLNDDKGEDMISNLPVHLQHTLLSYLPVEDVVKTSALSKHWNSTWKSFPILEFNQDTYLRLLVFREKQLTEWSDRFQQFLNYTDKSILYHSQHGGNSLVKVHIRLFFLDGKKVASRLDWWLNYALENNVKDLVIDQYYFNVVYAKERDEHRYTMPQAIFSAKFIQNLDLSGCRIINNNTMHTGMGLGSSLRRMKLTNIYINQETLENLVSNSSGLEDISISECEGFRVVRLCSTNLRSAYLDCTQNQFVRMETPNLESLSYEGSFDNLKDILKTSQNLKKLKLCYVKFTDHQYSFVIKKFPAVEIDSRCITLPQPT